MRLACSLCCLLLASPVLAQSGLPVPGGGEPRPNEAQASDPSLAEVAAQWAPDVYQDTDDSNTSADLITALDFDGDRVMTNNWENMERFTEAELLAQGTVYWWGSRTATHDYLGYAFFHPRDWLDGGLFNRVRGAIGPHVGKGTGEHENDLEGVLLVINRATGEPELMVTQAHNEFWQYGPEDAWKERGREDIDGPILRDPETGRVQVFIEAKGHGVYGSTSKTDFRPDHGDGVLYTQGGSSLQPRDGAHVVGYGLEDMKPWRDLFLAVPPGQANQTFDRTGRASLSGDTKDENAAQMPWGWKDNDYPAHVNPLFWSDPARFVSWMFEPTAPFSLHVQERTAERPRGLGGFARRLVRLVWLARLRHLLRKRALAGSPRQAIGARGALERGLR